MSDQLTASKPAAAASSGAKRSASDSPPSHGPGPSKAQRGSVDFYAVLTVRPGKTPSSNGKLILNLAMDKNKAPLGSSAAVYMENVLTDDEKAATALSIANHALPARATPQQLGLPTVGTDFDNVHDHYNQLVAATLAQTMCVVGVPKVSGLDHWVSVTDDGKMVNRMKTGHLFFSAIPMSDDEKPSLDNRLGSPEMLETSPGKFTLNPKFWYEQIFQGGKAKKMELAAFVPHFLLTDAGKIAHNSALDVMNQPNGIGIGGEYFKLVLWNHYAWIFKAMMETPLAKAARLHGFFPLFLLKQVINQKVKPDGTHAHLSSTDKNGKSALMLVGFWKDRSKASEERYSDIEFITLSANGSLPTIGYRGSAVL